MNNLQELFGSMVFNDNVMRQRLPKETYRVLHRTSADGRTLDPEVAGVVANAMKDWAIEKGATHYTHWFQPMTGVTAEKHDSFISPIDGGTAITEFGGKELVRGEPDASSFPSGGLRATFEARGYTAWDPTSYAFIKNNTLCIPTAFCSYGGQALDKKTPLLRSMEAVSRQSKRILKLFGHDEVRRVVATVGPEQEYFLIDHDLFEKRLDLMNCGKTLFGARPAKGQELDDHYFGSLKPRVSAFMREVDEELWKLGVTAKTEHNEAAPCQHELAPIYSSANIATDHNQLTMEIMKRVAQKHGFACLLGEKPFAGVNGSGKHNNWSLTTDTGVNLFEPGDTPEDNAQFLLFLMAVVTAVDEHQDLLRVSVAVPGNDDRLGASEAPPAIVSMFLGDELTAILDALEHHNAYVKDTRREVNVGVKTLPHIPKDSTDRNRTSPLAFTGNKFEFRSPGASMSIAGVNVVLNSIVADTLMRFADALEKAEDFRAAVEQTILDAITRHKRIVFNGNNYAKEWRDEAERRGLLNLANVPDILPYMMLPDNIALFERQRVYSAEEIASRYDIMLENYCKVRTIEAHTMLEMVSRQYLPAMIAYAGDVARSVGMKKAVRPALDCDFETGLIDRMTRLINGAGAAAEQLSGATDAALAIGDTLSQAKAIRDTVLPAMRALRAVVDEAETIADARTWPTPGYGQLFMTK